MPLEHIGSTQLGEGSLSESEWAILNDASESVINIINATPDRMRASIMVTSIVSFSLAQDDPDLSLEAFIDACRAALFDTTRTT